MKKSFSKSVVPVALFFCTLASTPVTRAANEPLLDIGSPAPALSLTHWYKGTPFKAFEPGKVYVVEFWATWCVPCKKSIPHLTELQKKFEGRATFLGVDVWEHPDEETDASIAESAKPFVEAMGDQMAYSVAGDGVAGVMGKTWLAAAQRETIPTAFIVNGKGQIAWLGHPDALEPVLDKVVDGSWDPAAEKKKAEDERIAAANAPENKLIAKLMKANEAGDYKAVLSTLDELDTNFPKVAAHPDLMSLRIAALMHTDPPAAVAYVQKVTAPGGLIAEKPVLAWAVTRLMRGNNESLLTQPQWKAIATAVDPMLSPGRAMHGPVYTLYAELLRRAGEHDLAVFYQRKGVNLIIANQKALKGKVSKADLDFLKAEQDKMDALTAVAGKTTNGAS